jgi:hypothetical protein
MWNFEKNSQQDIARKEEEIIVNLSKVQVYCPPSVLKHVFYNCI